MMMMMMMMMTNSPPVYKLYAVGTTEPDPEKWSGWDEITIVIARDKKDALRLGRDAICVEIPLDRSMVLMEMPALDERSDW